MVDFDNWDSMQENYRIYKNAGAIFLFDQGNDVNGWSGPDFLKLRAYLQSKLMWNTELDFESLVDTFMTDYYMDAAPKMREYFDYMCARNKTFRDKAWVDVMRHPEYYTKEYLDKCMSLFAEAKDAIAHYKDTDLALYQNLLYRIKTEECSSQFFLCSFYSSYYTADEYTAMIDDFESAIQHMKYGDQMIWSNWDIDQGNYAWMGLSITDIIARWRVHRYVPVA